MSVGKNEDAAVGAAPVVAKVRRLPKPSVSTPPPSTAVAGSAATTRGEVSGAKSWIPSNTSSNGAVSYCEPPWNAMVVGLPMQRSGTVAENVCRAATYERVAVAHVRRAVVGDDPGDEAVCRQREDEHVVVGLVVGVRVDHPGGEGRAVLPGVVDAWIRRRRQLESEAHPSGADARRDVGDVGAGVDVAGRVRLRDPSRAGHARPGRRRVRPPPRRTPSSGARSARPRRDGCRAVARHPRPTGADCTTSAVSRERGDRAGRDACPNPVR